MDRAHQRLVRGLSALCFSCGKSGHWKIDCVQYNSTNKISTKFLKAILTEKYKKDISPPLEKAVSHFNDEKDKTEVPNMSPVGSLKKMYQKVGRNV